MTFVVTDEPMKRRQTRTLRRHTARLKRLSGRAVEVAVISVSLSQPVPGEAQEHVLEIGLAPLVRGARRQPARHVGRIVRVIKDGVAEVVSLEALFRERLG